MPTLLSSIYTATRALLNDAAQDVFTDAILLPFAKKAYQELQDELALNGAQDTKEDDYSTNVIALATTITPPSDFWEPLELFEKAQGAADSEYVKMTNRSWDPDAVQGTTLDLWKYQENEIKLVGATTARTVKIKYLKFLTALVDATSSIAIINCETFLAARIAAIAAYSVGGNEDRAVVHNQDADKRLSKIIATVVKQMQDNPTRRKAFRA